MRHHSAEHFTIPQHREIEGGLSIAICVRQPGQLPPLGVIEIQRREGEASAVHNLVVTLTIESVELYHVASGQMHGLQLE
jgi:hypothetical protein